MPFFSGDTPQEFSLRLRRIYVLYTAGFALLILLMALAEILGMPRNWIGYVFLLVTVSLYAGIGIVCRTSDQVEYYVAGRRVPAIYNGMATAADWMSVASFIGVAGTLYLTGYGGLAYIMGWTGGYVLVAMLLAPYLRRFGQYTIPDFMGARYGGNLPRLAGVACAILCSFTYLVAQIYGVGIITTRMTGISFELGIFVALGGMLVCSFLGGMRAVTWTQVGQYIILVIAYLVPVVWLSVKHTGSPVPQVSAGIVLQQVAEKESYLLNDTGEIEVRRIWQERADEMGQRIAALPESWTLEKDSCAAGWPSSTPPTRPWWRSVRWSVSWRPIRRMPRRRARPGRSPRPCSRRAPRRPRRMPSRFPPRTRKSAATCAPTSWRWCCV